MTARYVRTLEQDSIDWIQTMDRDPIVGAVVTGAASAETYIRFLRGTYHYVRWSAPLLALTAREMQRRGRFPWLTELLERKTGEESSHDSWALRDLMASGVNPDWIKGERAPEAVTAYVRWSIALAEHGSPAFLGAAHALEFISRHRARIAADNLRASASIPNINHALSFLDGHGDADEEHLQVLTCALEAVDDVVAQSEIAISSTVLRTLFPKFFV